jgi:hypothetical protein
MRRFALVFTLSFIFILIFSPAVTRADPLIEGCQVFPLDNPWNADISGAAVHPNSDNYIANINANGGQFVHPDFGANPAYGIPYITVSGTQPKVPVTFDYDDESDTGPYPIPPNAPIEGGSDRHVIVIDKDNCVLYETYDSHYMGGSQNAWHAGSGAIFNLNSNALRPDGWTSADAAGLPIFPGLARCAEAMSGEINHAFRFTVRRTQRAYVYPATHYASSLTDTNYPPMGLRFRLKASYNLSGFTGQALVIATALKKYGMILADNGSNWYISGERNQNNCWNDSNLNQLKSIPGTAFEVIVSPPPPTVVLPAPSLSTPVDGEATTNAQPTLIWNTVTSATSYEIRLDRSNPPTTIVATIPSTSPTTYTPSFALLNVPYYWQVRAKSGAVTTDWSPVRQISITSTANAAPTRILFTTGTQTLTWNPIPGAANYEIQVDDNTNFAAPFSYTTTVGSGVFSVQPSLQSGRYYWHVRARKDGVWGSWSAAESFTVAR